MKTMLLLLFVNYNQQLETNLTKMHLLDLMNITPTESEAWDIVQMEEIERELMSGDDVA